MTSDRPAPGEVHVWTAQLPANADPREASHVHLARAVARYGERATTGHPARRRPVADNGLDVSLSRSRRLVVVAVSTDGDVGVDVELVLPPPPRVVVGELLSLREAEELDALAPAGRAVGFTRAWVRKEAVLKALGVGLALDTRLVDVGVDCAPRRIIRTSEGPLGVADVVLADHACAVALRGTTAPTVAVHDLDIDQPDAVARISPGRSGRRGRRTPSSQVRRALFPGL